MAVVSPEKPEGVELLLELSDNPVVKKFKTALFTQGIPAVSFKVVDIYSEYTRLKASGVEFSMEPTQSGDATVAVFDDTCGNLIQIYQA